LGLTLFSHTVVFAQGVILTPLIIKNSGAEVYGTYILWVSFLGIIFGISSLGIGIHFKRYAPSSTDHNKFSLFFFRQFNFQLLTILFLSSLTVIGYYIKFNSEDFNIEYLFLIPFYLLSYFLYSQTTDYYRYSHKYHVYNIVGVMQPIIFVLLTLASMIFYGNLSSQALIFWLSIAYSLLGLPLFIKIVEKIGLSNRIQSFRELIAESRVGFPLVLSYLLDVALLGSDKYIIALILSVKEVGYYVPAFALGVLPLVFSRAIGVILPPVLARSVDNNNMTKGSQMLEGVSRIYIYLALPYVVGGLIFGKEILSFYTTNEIAKYSWGVIPTIAVASLFYGLMAIKLNILFILLKTRDVFLYNLIGALLGIILNFTLLIIYKNIFYSALSALISYFICYLLVSYKINEYSFSFKININSWVIPISTSILMGLILFIIKKIYYQNEIFNLLIFILFGILIYLAVLLSLKPSREDIMRIYNLVN
jgi:O-antigen/teichoic acid export membrane protein